MGRRKTIPHLPKAVLVSGDNPTIKYFKVPSQLKYIELKTGHGNNGPAWISKVEFSKSGKTMYFNGKAFKGNGHGLCFDIATKETYWICGIKKNGNDRHSSGNGKIMLDREIISEYLAAVDFDFLDPKKYELVDIIKTEKQKFNQIENSRIDATNDTIKYGELVGLTIAELENTIIELRNKEAETNSNNGVKYYTIKRLEAERIVENLKRQNA